MLGKFTSNRKLVEKQAAKKFFRSEKIISVKSIRPRNRQSKLVFFCSFTFGGEKNVFSFLSMTRKVQSFVSMYRETDTRGAYFPTHISKPISVELIFHLSLLESEWVDGWMNGWTGWIEEEEEEEEEGNRKECIHIRTYIHTHICMYELHTYSHAPHIQLCSISAYTLQLIPLITYRGKKKKDSSSMGFTVILTWYCIWTWGGHLDQAPKLTLIQKYQAEIITISGVPCIAMYDIERARWKETRMGEWKLSLRRGKLIAHSHIWVCTFLSPVNLSYSFPWRVQVNIFTYIPIHIATNRRRCNFVTYVCLSFVINA